MEQSLDIWRKELSGPREILAPDTDFNYQTQKPELAEYGVLMPVFEIKYKTTNEAILELRRSFKNGRRS